MRPAIIAIGQSIYTRHPNENQNTRTLIRDAIISAVQDSGLKLSEIDGLAITSFSIAPDSAIDIAWRLGLSLKWLLQDTNGGSSAMNMLGHASRAIETNAASNIIIVAGDATGLAGYAKIANSYNTATRDHLSPIGHGGPNGVYALVTSRQMKKYNIEKIDYGRMAVAQRKWASLNPNAVYKQELTIEEYMDAPMVADPLARYDCVPVVAGSYALIISSEDNCPVDRKPVFIKSFMQSFNFDNQEGDGTNTGISTFADKMWEEAKISPDDIDVLSIYDDYPAMVIAQLNDLKMIPNEDVKSFLNNEIMLNNKPINTWGGMLSAGQPGGPAGGLNGIGEIVQQLQVRAGERQIQNVKYGIVTGYGMTLYRYGGTAAAAILEVE